MLYHPTHTDTPGITSNDNPGPKMVFVTGTFSLTCTYDAVPPPTVTWFQNGNMLMNGVNGAIINPMPNTRESGLIRSGLNAGSGGTYTCRATNVVGIANDSTQVVIQGRHISHALTYHTPSHLTH